MIPRLGEKYELEIEMVSKPNQEFRTEEYTKSGLPVPPAIMVADELVAQGCDVDEEKVEVAIRRHLAQNGKEGKQDGGSLSGG